MAGPWEKFKETPPAEVPSDAGPWSKFAQPTKPVSKPWEQFSTEAQPAEDKIEKEIRERSFLDRPFILSEEIKDTEVAQIAAKYGASPEKIREAIPIMAGMPENLSVSDVAKGVTGFAGEAVTLGVPQKLYRMAQDPKTEAALDELKQLIDARKSYLQYAAEFAMPGVGLGKVAKAAGGGIKGAAATGAIIGAAGGFGASKAGEEISSTLIGATAGGAIGGAVGKLADRLSKKVGRELTEEEAKAVSNLSIDKYKQEALKEVEEEGNVLTQELITGAKTPNKLTSEEMEKVLNSNYDKAALQYNLKQIDENPMTRRVDPDLAKNISFEFAAKRVLLEDIVDTNRTQILKDLGALGPKQETATTLGKTTAEMWSDIQRQGREYIGGRIKNHIVDNITLRKLENAGIFDNAPESAIGRVLGKLSDGKMHSRTIDTKWDTDIEDILSRLAQRKYLMGAIRESDKQSIEAIDKIAIETNSRKAAKSGKVIDIIEGVTDAATEGEKKVVDSVVKKFDDMYKFFTDGAAKLGLPPIAIPKLDKYAARMTKEVPEVIATIELEMTKCLREINEKLGTKYRDLTEVPAAQFAEKEVQDLSSTRNLREYINWSNNAEVKIPDGSRLAQAVRQALKPDDEGFQVLEKAARSTMERTALDRPIPNFIREKDVYKVLDRYSQDMLSYIYLREPLDELRSTAKILERRNGKSEAKFVENIIADTIGVRKGTVAHFMRDMKGQIARALNPKIDEALSKGQDTRAFVYTTIKEMVDLPGYLAQQIYPNLLGWRAVPILTNAAGGLARAAPELGGAYGYTTYARSLLWARQNWSAGAEELLKKGYIPGQWTRTGQRALADGIRASGLVNVPVHALEKLNSVGMWAYSKSEELNRISLLGMAKMMTHDLAQGVAGAQNALKKFPTSVQRLVSRAKSQEEVEDILMRHMNSTIAFNYDRSSLYEFGRTLGPVFATFAKWPTAIAGEIISEYRTKPMSAATRRVAERYAAPLMAFAAVDYLMKDELAESDRLQTLVGKTGITKAAPITSVAAFTRGDIFTPPAIDVLMKDIITPVSKAEALEISRGLGRATKTYAPGAGFYKFLTTDIPTLWTGEKPEK